MNEESFLIIMFGFIIPYLISANNTELVIFGFFLIIATPVAIWTFTTK